MLTRPMPDLMCARQSRPGRFIPEITSYGLADINPAPVAALIGGVVIFAGTCALFGRLIWGGL